MITIFSTPKPFVGQIDIIQRNAIKSWQRLHPDIEILLIGDDQGAAEVCQELRIRHVKDVRRNRNGTKYLASIYDRAQEVAAHDLLCHINCDILLMSDFRGAVESMSKLPGRFLLSGRRWDVDIREPWNFQRPDWEARLRKLARQSNRQRPAQWIDYFVFSKGLYYHQVPDFVIGRPGWDNWLLWFARSSGAAVIDASSIVCAVHQNHDYGYHPDGEKGVWEGEEAQQNYQLLKGHRKFRTLENATHLLQTDGLHRNHRHWLVQMKRNTYDYLYPVWFLMLDFTRPVRHLMGLRQPVDKEDTEHRSVRD